MTPEHDTGSDQVGVAGATVVLERVDQLAESQYRLICVKLGPARSKRPSFR
jgi:hypothetical protein